MTHFVRIYDAKTRLSELVERAAGGEEIIIVKNGVPRAQLMPGERRKPANAMRVGYLAADFGAPDPRITRLFVGETA